MEAKYYIPSDKYPAYTPFIFCGVIFLSSAVAGISYGLVNGFYHTSNYKMYNETNINMLSLMMYMILMAVILSYIAVKLIKLLTVRAPEIFSRLAVYASFFGWAFNWLSFYLIISPFHGDLGHFFSFFYDRLIKGFQVDTGIGARSGNPGLWIEAEWYIIAPFWCIESFIIPYFLGKITHSRASNPFSETTKTWHKYLVIPRRIFYPTREEVYESLEKADTSVLPSLFPPKYDNCGWGTIEFYYSIKKEDSFFVRIIDNSTSSENIAGIRFFRKKQRNRYNFWSISRQEAELLAVKFGGSLPGANQ